MICGVVAARLRCGDELQSGLIVSLVVVAQRQLAPDFARITRMHQLAARECFFVLHLEQDRLANPRGCWNWCERTSGLAVAEAATLMAAVDQVSKQYPVDPQRMAVAGLWAGASMATLIASLFPGRIKAVAMHSGVAPGAALSAVTAMSAMTGLHASPIRFTAVGKAVRAAALGVTLPGLMVVHGDADDVVAPGHADSTVAIWSMATGSTLGTERTWPRGKRLAVHETEFTRRGRTRVTLCKVQGLGHAWSGRTASLPLSDMSGPVRDAHVLELRQESVPVRAELVARKSRQPDATRRPLRAVQAEKDCMWAPGCSDAHHTHEERRSARRAKDTSPRSAIAPATTQNKSPRCTSVSDR